MPTGRPVPRRLPVHFVESFFDADLAYSPPFGQKVLRQARARLERDGQPDDDTLYETNAERSYSPTAKTTATASAATATSSEAVASRTLRRP